MFYRIKQFVWTIVAKINREEQALINACLSDREKQLFKKLKVYEQKHSLRVAYHLKGKAGKDQEIEYIRLGLLHDIGKSKYPLNPVEKSIIVILDALTKGKIKKMKHFKMVKCYYDHSAISYDLLKASGEYSDLFLEAIRDHHHQTKSSNELLKALKECDDIS